MILDSWWLILYNLLAMKPSLGVISFPGNNCESESVRAGQRNGFETTLILWNDIQKIGNLDAYFLIGGFAYEDRGRSGAIAAREKLFDAVRSEAKKGKLILGVCNGAQMIVESGLIPREKNPVPFAIAENIRRDKNGKVLGTGFYNEWITITPIRKDTAFTNKAQKILHLPVAHGEGRFTTIDPKAKTELALKKNVAYRYCDEQGQISDQFPTTPNGAMFAVAMIVNDEGTIGAIMPHPERFYDHCDGDQIFQSMRAWIEEKKSPVSVHIGDFSKIKKEEPVNFKPKENAILIEKKLIITDNESFSISAVASNIASEKQTITKSILFEISTNEKNKKNLKQKILDSGLLFNPNKEWLCTSSSPNKYAILPHDDDQAKHLEERLETILKQKVSVRILKCWDFGNASQTAIQKILQNKLLANPNSATLYKIEELSHSATL